MGSLFQIIQGLPLLEKVAFAIDIVILEVCVSVGLRLWKLSDTDQRVLDWSVFRSSRGFTMSPTNHWSECLSPVHMWDQVSMHWQGMASTSSREGGGGVPIPLQRLSGSQVIGFLKIVSLCSQDSDFYFVSWQWPHFSSVKRIEMHHMHFTLQIICFQRKNFKHLYF